MSTLLTSVALARPAVPGDRSDRATDTAARMAEHAGQTVAAAKLSVGEQSARAHGGPRVSDPAHRTGMDPMSVCLAVLGAALLALVLLLTAAALRRRLAARPAARALLRDLWPLPPPPRHKSLARLSVLRV
ncbi:hypothetical protein [Streptomyces albireticuli]|uniref:hypothetical protein n=1 Tax=Streptomyces albireticuli TaxID=1940 RepID=UPI003690F1A7